MKTESQFLDRPYTFNAFRTSSALQGFLRICAARGSREMHAALDRERCLNSSRGILDC